MRKWKKLLFASSAIMIPFISTISLVSCSNKDQSNTNTDNNKKDDNENKEPVYATKSRETTYFLNNFLLRKPNCGDTALQELKKLEQNKLYTWDVYNDSLSFTDRFISSGLGTLYINDNDVMTTTRTQFQIPPLNFYGKDIRFVTGGKYTQEGDPKQFIPRIIGHYEIDNVYVSWYYKNGEKANRQANLGTIYLYAALNPYNVTNQLQELQKESRPVINQDVYLEFYEKVNGHPL